MGRKVIVCPYQIEWKVEFSKEAQRLRNILKDEVVAIYHIGSTAVNNLCAKPIIDILVEVTRIQNVDAYNLIFIQNDYTPKGENGIPGRRYFVKGTEIVRTHHVHIYEENHPQVERHLALVSYLNANPDDASAYGELKNRLAKEYPENIDAYVDGKDAYVKQLEQKALAWFRVEQS